MFGLITLILMCAGIYLIPIGIVALIGYALYRSIKYATAPLIQEEEYIFEDDDIYKEEEENKSEDVSTYKAPFRPTDFKEYIGQASIKDTLKEFIASHKIRNKERLNNKEEPKPFPHFIVSGNAGTGKTLLTQIIANQLDVPFVECIGSEIEDIDYLKEKVFQTHGGILLLDEVHSINRDILESIYRIMEEFKDVIPFTLCGCTTELGEIIKDRKPFYERFKLPIILVQYTQKEIETMARQYKTKEYPKEFLDEKVYRVIGANSKGTPRTAYRFIDIAIMLNGNIEKVLKFFNIIKDGFTLMDYRLLAYLNKSDKPVGMKGLMAYLGTSQSNYEYEIEPYLIQKEIIQKTSRGRSLTDIGKSKLKELDEIVNKRKV